MLYHVHNSHDVPCVCGNYNMDIVQGACVVLSLHLSNTSLHQKTSESRLLKSQNVYSACH